MMTLQDLQQTVSRYVESGRKRRELRRELAQLAAMGSLDAVLADVGLVRSQIEPLLAGSGDSGELLEQMLARLGIDAGRLPVETQRGMLWACMNCQDKGQCRHWLAGDDHADFHSFCPNAGELDQALAQGGHPAPPPRETPYHPSADDVRRMRGETLRGEVRTMLDSGF